MTIPWLQRNGDTCILFFFPSIYLSRAVCSHARPLIRTLTRKTPLTLDLGFTRPRGPPLKCLLHWLWQPANVPNIGRHIVPFLARMAVPTLPSCPPVARRKWEDELQLNGGTQRDRGVLEFCCLVLATGVTPPPRSRCKCDICFSSETAFAYRLSVKRQRQSG